MEKISYISAKHVEHLLTWTGVCDALTNGHLGARADLKDILLRSDDNAVLSRAAWIEGAGITVKTATIFPNNKTLYDRPNVQAIVTLFDAVTGTPTAIIDGGLVTKWKTAGDSVLGARYLARRDSKTLTILGAGSVAGSLVDAYREVFPDLEKIFIWNRTEEAARLLAKEKKLVPVTDLIEAVGKSDIVSCATMSVDPVLQGSWVRPGTHVDLIGAYRPDMREADDQLIAGGELFVDSRETTVTEIGELLIPIQRGVISASHIRGDFYDLCNGASGRLSENSVTIFKNGGGAHLDLMTALYIRQTAETAKCGDTYD